MKKIKPPIGSIKILMEEFNVTRTTVDQALKFYNNSEKGEAIRKRAIEMLEKELNNANEIKETLKTE